MNKSIIDQIIKDYSDMDFVSDLTLSFDDATLIADGIKYQQVCIDIESGIVQCYSKNPTDPDCDDWEIIKEFNIKVTLEEKK